MGVDGAVVGLWASAGADDFLRETRAQKGSSGTGGASSLVVGAVELDIVRARGEAGGLLLSVCTLLDTGGSA